MRHADLAAAWLGRVRSISWREHPRLGDDGESAAVWGLVLAADRYRPDGVHAFSTWAIPYARREVGHLVVRETRHGRKGQVYLRGSDPFRSREPDPARVAAARVDAAALLGTLPARTRRVIELTVMEGRTRREAARLLGVAASTVMLHKSRGLAALRRAVA
jgi:RNA polymerase sigma factor (sigma-70 family)